MLRYRSDHPKPVSAVKHKGKGGSIPPEWEKWCSTGRHKGHCKRRAVLQCLKDGIVRGYFSDFPLNPKLKPTDSMYPSVEHLTSRQDSKNVAVETRIVNDMKSHLSEKEFWQLIGHLHHVGRKKLKGNPLRPANKPLLGVWHPERNFRRARSRR